MSMRKKAPMPLDILRSKVRKDGADILALKAAVQDLGQRMAKVEVAVGTGRSSGMPPNVEQEDTREEEAGEAFERDLAQDETRSEE